MDKDRIAQTIRGAEAELRDCGIAALYLFGSRARGDARADSDIDLAFDIAEDRDTDFSLMDQARAMLRLQELLGTKVDLVSRYAMRPHMRARVDAQMIKLL